jgi:hypothetical protein
MNFKDIVSLHEAYVAVYDEELRDELESSSIQEDLSFIDDLSDNELDLVMEDLFVSGDIDINECFDSLDYVLSEGRVDMSARTARARAYAQSSETAAREARNRASAKERSERRAERIGRITQAAQRVGERLASPARSTGGTSASARVGQASQKVRSAAQQVKGFLGKVGRTAKAGYEAAKKEFSGQAGREARARTTGRQMRRAARAQRGRDTSEFERNPTWRPGGQNVNRTFKPQQGPTPAAKSDESKPTWRPGGHNFANRTFKPQQGPTPAPKGPKSKPSWRAGGQNVGRTFKPQQGPTPAPKGPRSPAPYRNVGKSDDKSSSSGRALSGSSVKAALPPAKESDRRAAAKAKLQKASAGSTARGIRFAGERVGQLATQRAHTGRQSALEKFRKKAGISEDIFNDILNIIFEEMIHEGYVDSYENALYVFESLSEFEVQDIVESYLVEEIETVDLYDVVLEHLLDEGFAETEDEAAVIMANMSEEWRDEILDEGFKRMDRAKIERQARKLGGDRGDVLRAVADKMDTEVERKYSTRQARLNRAGGAGSEYRKAQELRARDDAKADFKKYGLR